MAVDKEKINHRGNEAETPLQAEQDASLRLTRRCPDIIDAKEDAKGGNL